MAPSRPMRPRSFPTQIGHPPLTPAHPPCPQLHSGPYNALTPCPSPVGCRRSLPPPIPPLCGGQAARCTWELPALPRPSPADLRGHSSLQSLFPVTPHCAPTLLGDPTPASGARSPAPLCPLQISGQTAGAPSTVQGLATAADFRLLLALWLWRWGWPGSDQLPLGSPHPASFPCQLTSTPPMVPPNPCWPLQSPPAPSLQGIHAPQTPGQPLPTRPCTPLPSPGHPAAGPPAG